MTILTLQEAARLLRVHHTTLAGKVRAGDVPDDQSP